MRWRERNKDSPGKERPQHFRDVFVARICLAGGGSAPIDSEDTLLAEALLASRHSLLSEIPPRVNLSISPPANLLA